jgi:hypothetical protein
MTPIRFVVDDEKYSQAQAALARYLPGLDVQLFEYHDGSVLMPPHLWLSLATEYGRSGALQVLAKTGLHYGGRVASRGAT